MSGQMRRCIGKGPVGPELWEFLLCGEVASVDCGLPGTWMGFTSLKALQTSYCWDCNGDFLT